MNEHPKPFRDVGVVAASLGITAWLLDLILATGQLTSAGNALLLMSAPLLLAQVWIDQKTHTL